MRTCRFFDVLSIHGTRGCYEVEILDVPTLYALEVRVLRVESVTPALSFRMDGFRSPELGEQWWRIRSVRTQ